MKMEVKLKCQHLRPRLRVVYLQCLQLPVYLLLLPNQSQSQSLYTLQNPV